MEEGPVRRIRGAGVERPAGGVRVLPWKRGRLIDEVLKLPRESQVAETRFELVDALLVWLNGEQPRARRGARALFVG